MGMADVTEPSPLLSADQPPRSKASPALVAVPDEAPERADPPDMGLVIALVALILVGVAVVVSQFSFGRVIAVGIAGLGFVGGLAALLSDGRAKLAGAMAVGLHGLILLAVLFLPSWLRLDPWQTPLELGRPEGPQAVEHGGGHLSPVSPVDWIDAGKFSWQNNDVRVTVRSAFLGSVEGSGKKDAKRMSKDQYFHIYLRVANAGIEREIVLSGWAVGQKVEEVVVTDPAGKIFKPARLEENKLTDRGKPLAHLFPGNKSEPYLIFAAPQSKPESLHVRLPGSAVGASEEIRFQIGRALLVRSATP